MRRLLGIIASLIAGLLICSCAQTSPQQRPTYEPPSGQPVPVDVDSVTVTGSWQPPSSGTPCVSYECEWYHGQLDVVPSNEHLFTIPENLMTRMRVRGVDIHGEVGPWSGWSDWWPDGASHVPLD